MLTNIAIGAMLILLTTAVHAAGMILAFGSIRRYGSPAESKVFIKRVFQTAGVVLVMYLVAVVEVLVWGAAYRVLGAFEDMETAVYFSAVTFTTLGFGDVVLDGSRRILSSFEAVNGILMFGWSTAIVIAAVQRVYSRGDAGEDSHPGTGGGRERRHDSRGAVEWS
jgi:hypothetical protein